MVSKPQQYYELDLKKHGVGGIVTTRPTPRKQDNRAIAAEAYAVVFFPKFNGIGKAQVHFFGLGRSLAQSPGAAKMKFMDEMKQGEQWLAYARAGHRVRKLKIIDLGDAQVPSRPAIDWRK